MKFVPLSLPAIPAAPDERQRLRPVGHRTDRWPQMIEESGTLAPMLDDYGWEAYIFPQHELHAAGHEVDFSTARGVGPCGSGHPRLRLAHPLGVLWLPRSVPPAGPGG